MFEIIKFKVEHLESLSSQPANQGVKAWISNGHAKTLEEKADSVSGIVNGQVAICAGTIEYWEGRALLWTVFNTEFKRNFFPVYKCIQTWLDQQPYRRLEMAVPYGFDIGCRRALMLGFNIECGRAKAFMQGGGDAVLFSRVRE